MGYQSLMFVDNRKRDKTLFELPYTDLLYIMGKREILKLGMILHQKAGSLDCKTELLVQSGGARSIAEDVLTYSQIYILEHQTKTQEYCEFQKRQIIDGLFDTDLQGMEGG